MNGSPGGGAADSARPDHEPTINEPGIGGFVVDGTDSFAVPGPADGVVPGDVAEPPAISPTRVLVTAGAVVAGLVFVVAVGSGGGSGAAEGSTLRTAGDGSVFLVPRWGGGDDDPVLVARRPDDADTLLRLEEGGAPADPDTVDPYVDADLYDDEFLYDGASIPSYPAVDAGDIADDDVHDDDFSPSYTPPRRPSTSRRPVITSPPRRTRATATTTTTQAEVVETTTTESTTTTSTTVETTTTTVEATTTTSPTLPARTWQPAAGGLPDCPTSVWMRDGGLVASVGAQLHQSAGGTWTPLGGAVPGATAVRAVVVGSPATTFWVGTDAGVFVTHDGGVGYTEVPSATDGLADVRSLAVSPNGTSLLAVTGTGQLHHLDGTGTTWSPVELALPTGVALGEVLFVDDTHAVLGTSAGVLQMDGEDWTSASSTPVVGRPVRGAASYSWLAAGGAGVVQRIDGGTWTTTMTAAGVIDPAATALVERAGQLITSGLPGGGSPVISSGDGFVEWSSLGPDVPYRPDGFVRTATATYAFRAWCGDGVTESVLVLADP